MGCGVAGSLTLPTMMSRPPLALLLPLAGGLLAACTTAPPPVAASCDKDFGAFLSRFEADRAFQEQHISFPLKFSAREGSRELSAERVRGGAAPVFPLAPAQQKQSLKVSRQMADGAASVKLFVPNSDAYSVTYQFAYTAGCWRLAGVQDQSL